MEMSIFQSPEASSPKNTSRDLLSVFKHRYFPELKKLQRKN